MKPASILINTIFFFAFIGCGEKNPSNIKSTASDSLSKIEYQDIEPSHFSELLSLNGTAQITPSKITYINIPLGGKVGNFNKINGDYITQGERICYFENHQYLEIQKTFLTLSNEYKLEKINLDRIKQLSVGQSVSKKEVEELEFKIRSIELQLKSAEKELEFIGLNPRNIRTETLSSKIEFKAPFSGKISQIQCKNGSILSAETNAFVLVGGADMVSLNAYSKDLSKIKIGQTVEIKSIDQVDLNTQGIVTAIDPLLNSNGVFNVSVKYNNPNFTIGQPVLGQIKMERVSCFKLPLSNIVEYQGKFFIVISENGRLKNTEIHWLGEDQIFGYFTKPNKGEIIKRVVKTNTYGWFMKNLNS